MLFQVSDNISKSDNAYFTIKEEPHQAMLVLLAEFYLKNFLYMSHFFFVDLWSSGLFHVSHSKVENSATLISSIVSTT